MEANGNAKPQPKFEQWCVIEMMGHQQIAGFVTEATIAGGAYLRVDVPNPDSEGDLYTRYLGSSAIYAINPTTKEEVLAAVRLMHPKPPTPRTRERRRLTAHNDRLYDHQDGEHEEEEEAEEDVTIAARYEHDAPF